MLAPGGAWAQRRPTERLSPFERAKADQLLATRLPCLGCHAIGGKGGRQGPDLSGVGTRLTPRQIGERIDSPRTSQPDSLMPVAVMPVPWRDLLVKYLSNGEAPESHSGASVPPPVRPASGGDEANGRRLYARFCTGCHGDEGRGNGPNAQFLPVPPSVHSDAKAMGQRSDDQLFDTIAAGGYIMNRHPFMPAYSATLSPGSIRALVQHIRVLCSCRGPSWSSDGDRNGRP